MSQEQEEQVLQNSEPQSVEISVNVGGDSRAERFLGTFDQISRLSLDIDRNYGNKSVLTDFPLEHDGAKWTGTINKLIVGFDYTITGHAYKNDNDSGENSSDNNSFTEIFRGSTQHTVTEGTNSLNLRLSPLLDDRELTVPRITRIKRPFQMVASTSDNITVTVDTVKKYGSSAVDAILSYRFRSVDNDSLPLDNITGGSFTPASGDVTKSGSSYQDISTTYTAPDNDSTLKLQVRVSNELEIGVTSHFNVYVTNDIETQNTIDTNPVIENITAERLDNGDLKWTMNVSNDDGFNGLMVKWEYLFGDNRSFTNKTNTASQGNSNRGVMLATMSGYQDSDNGMLLVTVCEDGGSAGIPYDCAYMNEASTSISMELIPGSYYHPTICDGDVCESNSFLIGNWINCKVNEYNANKKEANFTNDKFSLINSYYYNVNDNCNGTPDFTSARVYPSYQIHQQIVVDNSDIGYKISSDNPDVFVTTFNEGNISYFNDDQVCGHSDWSIGQAKNVTECDFFHFENEEEYKDIIYYNSDILRFGDKSFIDENGYPKKLKCEVYSRNGLENNVCNYNVISENIIEDKDSGLMWAQTESQFSLSLDHSIKLCSDLSEEGESNFRIPSINELVTLVGSNTQNIINNYYFDKIKHDFYWSITEDYNSNYNGVDFSSGDNVTRNKNNLGNVICVSGCAYDYNDIEIPTLLNIRTSNNLININDNNTLILRLSATDNCNIDYIYGNLHSPSSMSSPETYISKYVNFNKQNDGEWTGNIEFESFDEAGIWGLTELYIVDKKGNNLELRHEGEYSFQNEKFINSDINVPIIELIGTTSDTTSPELIDLKISPENVTPDDYVEISLQVNELESGLNHLSLILYSPGGVVESGNAYSWTSKTEYIYFNVNNNNELFTKNIKLNQYYNNGEWIIGFIQMRDKTGNERNYYYQDNASYYVWDEQNKNIYGVETSISVGKINLSNATPDLNPPIIEQIIYDPPYLEGPGEVDVKIYSSDNLSGLCQYCSFCPNLKSPESNTVIGCVSNFQFNHSDGFYYGKFRIEDYHLPGDWTLKDIGLNDKNGNHVHYSYSHENDNYTYWNNDLKRNIITNIPLSKINISGTNPDITPPVLNEISFEPTYLNGPGIIKVKVDSTDLESGINSHSSFCGNLQLPNSNVGIPNNSCFNYNFDENIFEGTFEIKDYHPSGIYTFENFEISNNAGVATSHYHYNSWDNESFYVYWNEDSQTNITSAINLAQFNVSGTNHDITPPTIEYISINPNITTRNGNIKLTLKTFDSESGIDWHWCISPRLVSIDLENYIYPDNGCFHGNESESTFDGMFNIDSRSTVGEYIVEDFRIANLSGSSDKLKYVYDPDVSNEYYVIINELNNTKIISDVTLVRLIITE